MLKGLKPIKDAVAKNVLLFTRGMVTPFNESHPITT
jgi:hypothetical protein